jgi:tRNA 2-selenouridine synthase
MGWQKYYTRWDDPAFICLDLRQPEDFAQGHLPGSISVPFPLPSEGMDKPKRVPDPAYSAQMAKAAQAWAVALTKTDQRKMLLMCRDGGIISTFAHDALKDYGSSLIFRGGYAGYKREVENLFIKNYHFRLIAGQTGVGKTWILERLRQDGFQVLDLEALAYSKGSVFGRVGLAEPQPTQEHFRNLLASSLVRMKPDEPLYVEEELRPLGGCHVPQSLAAQFSIAPRIILKLPEEERVAALVATYAGVDDKMVVEGIEKLAPRIGEGKAGELVQWLARKAYTEVAKELIRYYDQSESYTIQPGEADVVIEAETRDILYEKVLVSIKEKRPR